MNSETDIRSEKRAKRIKRLKRRLLPSLLAGFLLPITLFLYGPFDLYAQNSAELVFSLYDFLLPCVLLTLACGLVLSAIPLFLGKKAYSVYIAVLFWATAMFFIQGSYLNFGITSLEGDGIGESAVSVSAVVVNSVIWLVTLAAVVFFVLKFKAVRKKLRFIVSFGLALVLVMEATGVAAVSIGNGEIYSRKKIAAEQSDDVPRLLTNDGLTTLSSNKNVVIFIVDRFDTKYYREAAAEYPEIFSELEGFTYYSDYTTLYARTFPSVVSILTEYENDYSDKRTDYIKKAYENADSLRFMKEAGYSIGIYSDSYYTYTNASDMREFTDNVTSYTDYTVNDKAGLFGSMLTLSAYRYFPLALKGVASGISTETFSRYVDFKADEGQQKYTTDNKTVYEWVKNCDFKLSDEYGRLNFIHIQGCHSPNLYGADFEELDEQTYDTDVGMKQSFKIISRYLSEMKRLGVYENSTVIITGDHASAVRDKTPVEGARVTTLLVKESGKSSGATVTNTAEACQDDIWATVFESEKLEGYPECKGTAVFLLDENAVRERRYIFHRYIDSESAEEMTYRIKGNANVFSNWELVGSRYIRGIYN